MSLSYLYEQLREWQERARRCREFISSSERLIDQMERHRDDYSDLTKGYKLRIIDDRSSSSTAMNKYYEAEEKLGYILDHGNIKMIVEPVEKLRSARAEAMARLSEALQRVASIQEAIREEQERQRAAERARQA